MTELPDLDRPAFGRRLERWLQAASAQTGSPDPASVALREPGGELVDRLFGHYRELHRWAPRLSLVGGGTAAEVVERHYGESLLGAELCPDGGVLLDLGSGGGFPGLVVAARHPGLRVVLVEARLRKATFLRSAARRMGLAVTVLQERIGPTLPPSVPEHVDCVTARAIRFEAPAWEGIAARVAPGGHLLLWAGAQPPEIPGFDIDRVLVLPDSHSRRILRYRRAPSS